MPSFEEQLQHPNAGQIGHLDFPEPLLFNFDPPEPSFEERHGFTPINGPAPDNNIFMPSFEEQLQYLNAGQVGHLDLPEPSFEERHGFTLINGPAPDDIFMPSIEEQGQPPNANQVGHPDFPEPLLFNFDPPEPSLEEHYALEPFQGTAAHDLPGPSFDQPHAFIPSDNPTPLNARESSSEEWHSSDGYPWF